MVGDRGVGHLGLLVADQRGEHERCRERAEERVRHPLAADEHRHWLALLERPLGLFLLVGRVRAGDESGVIGVVGGHDHHAADAAFDVLTRALAREVDALGAADLHRLGFAQLCRAAQHSHRRERDRVLGRGDTEARGRDEHAAGREPGDVLVEQVEHPLGPPADLGRIVEGVAQRDRRGARELFGRGLRLELHQIGGRASVVPGRHGVAQHQRVGLAAAVEDPPEAVRPAEHAQRVLDQQTLRPLDDRARAGAELHSRFLGQSEHSVLERDLGRLAVEQRAHEQRHRVGRRGERSRELCARLAAREHRLAELAAQRRAHALGDRVDDGLLKELVSLVILAFQQKYPGKVTFDLHRRRMFFAV